MKKSILLFTLSVLLFCCQNSLKVDDSAVSSNESSVETETNEQELLEFAPSIYLQSLLGSSNAIEATMYNSGASFSLFDPASVAAFMQLITLKSPKASSTNPIGHLMFLQNGENILIANVYTNGSDVFMQIIDNESGKTYYNNLAGKAKELFTQVQLKVKK